MPSRRPPGFVTAAVVAAAVVLTACGRAPDHAVSPGVGAPPTSARPAPVEPGGLFPPSAPQPPSAPAVPTAPAATVLIGVPPLPADLQHAAPPASAPSGDGHDHPGGELPPAGDVAAAWVAAVYTGRGDDPPGTAQRFLAPLAGDDEVAAAAATTLTPLDVGEARWPVITAVAPDGGGWWHVELLIKTTRRGQHGAHTERAEVRVHVTAALLVDTWEITAP